MHKIVDFFINRYYFNTLHEYDNYTIQDKTANQIKLFQTDKLICLNDNDIKIYNIFEKNFLCKIKLKEIKSIYEDIRKIELFGNDKFIIYNSDEFDYIDKEFILFQFIHNKEKGIYYCKKLVKIEENANNILIIKNEIICIKKGFVNIYSFINTNKNVQLQTKITIPKLINEYSFHKGVIINEKNIKIIEYHDLLIEFWNLKKYKLEHEINIKIDNYVSGYKLIFKKLDDNIIIFSFSNYIYFYSNNDKIILKKIKLSNGFWEILDIAITKNEEIFLNDRNNIYALDIINNKEFALTKYEHNFDNSLIILKKKNDTIFIVNSKNKIQFFHKSITKTITDDIYLFLNIWIFFIMIIKYLFSEISKSDNKKISFLFAILSSWIIKKLSNYLYFKEKMEYITIILKLSTVIFIIVDKFHTFLLPIIIKNI